MHSSDQKKHTLNNITTSRKSLGRSLSPQTQKRLRHAMPRFARTISLCSHSIPVSLVHGCTHVSTCTDSYANHRCATIVLLDDATHFVRQSKHLFTLNIKKCALRTLAENSLYEDTGKRKIALQDTCRYVGKHC